MSSPLAKKLQIKAGQTIAVLNAPPGYDDALGPLPADVRQSDKLEGQLGFVQVFVKKKQELDSVVPAVLRALKEDGLLWVSYPKGGSKVDTDLNRDILWEAMGKFGLAGVSMVSIDNVWSAMRFRPSDKVGK